MRRGYNGTFRHIEPKHPRRYVNEFAGRLSDGAASAVEKMGNIVRNPVGKRLTYGRLITGKSLRGGLSRRATDGRGMTNP